MAPFTRRKPTPARARVLPGAFASRLVWNPAAARYFDPATGRFLGGTVVRGIIDLEIDNSARRMQMYSRELSGGLIDINRWRDLMAAEIKLNHYANYAAAKGGFAHLTDADYKKIEKEVRRQYRYLEKFARQIDARPELAQRKGFFARVAMYAEAGRDTYEETRREAMRAAGYKWERNILHAAESCAGCLAETARGWVPIGTLARIGRRICLVRCRCTLEYRKSRPSMREAPDTQREGWKRRQEDEARESRDDEELPEVDWNSASARRFYGGGTKDGTGPEILSPRLHDLLREKALDGRHEFGALIDRPTGKIRQLLRGEKDRIEFDPDVIESIADLVTVHTHDEDLAFSGGDWTGFLLSDNADVDILITPSNIHVLRKTHAFDVAPEALNGKTVRRYWNERAEQMMAEGKDGATIVRIINEELAEMHGVEFESYDL
jgi:hypothetical protein